jgi:hypothetical protein
MAKAKLSPMLELIRGQVGNIVFKRYGDRVIISKKPVFKNRKFTKAQKNNQARFKDASTYGKMALANPELRKRYEQKAVETGKPILSLMIADFLHPPTVHLIDLTDYEGAPGGEILTHAKDDFEVAKVTIAILDQSGTAIEQGDATYASGDIWVYSSTATATGEALTVEATAYDRPGHSASLRREMGIEAQKSGPVQSY